MHMEQRNRMEQHVARLPAPEIVQRLPVGAKIPVSDHCAFWAPGRAGRIEDRADLGRVDLAL